MGKTAFVFAIVLGLLYSYAVSQTRTFNVCIMTCASTGYENSDPLIWYVVNTSPYKPAGWNFVNPIAPPGYSQAQREYWEVRLDAVPISELLLFDLCFITTHYAVNFTPEDRAKLEHFVRCGGKLWFDDCGNMSVSNFFLPFNFNSYTGENWGKVPVDPAHPFLNDPWVLTPGEIDNLGHPDFGSRVVGYDPGVWEIVLLNRSSRTTDVMRTTYGLGEIIVTSDDYGCAIYDYVNAEDIKFACNVVKYMSELRAPIGIRALEPILADTNYSGAYTTCDSTQLIRLSLSLSDCALEYDYGLIVNGRYYRQGDPAFSYRDSILTFTPPGSYGDDSVNVCLVASQTIRGYFFADTLCWFFYIDSDSPRVIPESIYPRMGEIIQDTSNIFFSVVDSSSGLDTNSICVSVNEHNFCWGHPALRAVLGGFRLDLGQTGVPFRDDDSVRICFTGEDSPNYCAPHSFNYCITYRVDFPPELHLSVEYDTLLCLPNGIFMPESVSVRATIYNAGRGNADSVMAYVSYDECFTYVGGASNPALIRGLAPSGSVDIQWFFAPSRLCGGRTGCFHISLSGAR